MIKDRYQMPTVGDTVRLRLMSLNQYTFSDLESINQVDIYLYDKCQPGCPLPPVVTTIPGTQVVRESEGNYYVDLVTSSPDFMIAEYQDVWRIFTKNNQAGSVTKKFKLYQDQWFFSSLPPVYSFTFKFGPNKIRKGSKKYLAIQVVPNVPKACELENFYAAMAISGVIKINIEKSCGPCLLEEKDLRIVVEDQIVELREGANAYYYLDTTEMDCGIYNVWFELDVNNTVEVSSKYQMEIF